MNQKSKTLNNLLGLFRELVVNLHKNSDFDYPGRPVGASTNWDFLPSDSVLVVYSIDGDNSPSINTLNNVGTTGFVITFSSPLGGNNQIFINSHVLALRKIGSPAGWNYLGLGSNEKIYMDHNAAQILKNVTSGLQYHNFVTDDSDQEIGGQKDFDILPLFNGQPLVYHSEFARLKKYVRDCLEDTKQTDQDVEANDNDIDTLSANFSSLQSDIADNYVNQGELSNYTPLSQLEYYVTKKELRDILGSTDVDGIKSTIHQMNLRCQNLKSELHKIAVQADSTDTEKIANLNNQIQSLSNNFNQKLSGIDLNKVKDTIHKMNVRYEHLVNQDSLKNQDITNQLNTLKKSIDGINNILSHLDLGKVKDTIHKMNIRYEHLANVVNSEKADKATVALISTSMTSVADNASSASNQNNTFSKAISANTSHASLAISDLSDVKDHFKRANKRYTDAINNVSNTASMNSSAATANKSNISSLKSQNSALSSTVDSLHSDNSKVASLAYNQAEADESSDVSSLENEINQIKNAILPHK